MPLELDQVDLLLGLLSEEYAFIVEHASSWNQLGHSEQLSLEFEEPLRRQHLDELRACAAAGHLTREQQRLADLEEYVARHNETIERIVYPWKFALTPTRSA